MNAWWAPPTLRSYQASWLLADAVAGLTLAAVAVPSQIATARLAGMPAVSGLYAFVVASLLYAALGPNRHVSVGADSTIAPVLATGVASVAAVGTARYVGAMAMCAMLIGAVLVAIGLLRMGWIADLLSTPVTTGVLAGIGVEIIVRELPVVLGITARGSTTIGRVRYVVGHLGQTNVWSLGIAIVVLGLVLAARRVDPRLPAALAGMVLSVLAMDVLGLASRHGVATVGAFRASFPSVGLPAGSWTEAEKLAATVLTVAFICIAQTAATVRAPAAGSSGRPVPEDFNRDLIGVGAGSIAAGLIGVFAVDASPPNSAIAEASGARSQLTNTVAAVIVVIAVLVATGPLAALPAATLGAILIFIATRLVRGGELVKIGRFNRVELVLAVTTLLAVALVGIEQGVGLAMVLSLAERTWRSARPNDALLGREPGTDHWVPRDVGYPTEDVPGVLVYLVYAPLWYGNADYLRQRILRHVDVAPEPVRAVVLDADGMSDIDYTGLQALRDMAVELDSRGVALCVARASHLVHHDLKHGALLAQLGPNRLFGSVEEAVVASAAFR